VTRHEATLLQLVEQARDVRGPRDQPAGQVQRADRSGMGSGQQAQGVVLLCGEVMLAEQLFLQDAEAVVGTPQVEEDFLLDRVKRTAGRDLAGGCLVHALQDSTLDNSCPDRFLGRVRIFADPFLYVCGRTGGRSSLSDTPLCQAWRSLL